MKKADLILQDAAISNQLSLLRFTAGERKKVLAILGQLQKDLRVKILGDLTDFGKARVDKLLREADDIIKNGYNAVQLGLDFNGLADHVAEVTAKPFVAIGLDAGLPTVAVMKALVKDSLIEGSPSAIWWSKQADDVSFKFAAQVRQGIAGNETVQQIVRRVVGSPKLGTTGIMETSRRGAAALVHTSIQQVANDARLATFKANDDVVKGVRFLATLDSHISLTCIAHSGAEWDLDGNPLSGNMPFASPPLHFNCLAGDTVISAAGVSKQYKRWFAGEVVVLSVTGIDAITVTPNHPVLTDHGWVAAGLLKKGDNLVFCEDTDAIISAINPDDHHMKTRIDNVGESLLMSGGVRSGGMPSTSKDFHGDGIIDNKVDVVFSDRLFPGDKHVWYCGKKIKNKIFAFCHAARVFFSALGSCAKVFESADLTPNGIMGSGGASSPGGRASFFSLKGISFTDGSKRKAKSLKHVSNNTVVSSSSFSNIVCGFASHIIGVKAAKLLIGKYLPTFDFQRQPLESIPNSIALISDTLGDVFDSFASHVSLVKLNDVAVRKYSSHVYNLQSDYGWYIVNIAEPQYKSKGIIVKNCRSVLTPITKTYRELGIDIDEVPPGTRASDEGQIRADITMAEWLRGKPAGYVDNLLGPGRAKLFLDGKITLPQLVDFSGNPLTLKQLKSL